MAKKKTTLPSDFGTLIKENDVAAIKEVFEKCDINAVGGYSKETALSFFKITEEVARWLVEQGADINYKNKYERTALHSHASSYCGNVQLLIELGADIKALDYQNETPLFSACEGYHIENIKTLINNGANIDVKNKSNQTPFIKALMICNNANIVDMVEVSNIFINAGTKVTDEMKEYVSKIGKHFEFSRDVFNPEFLEETSDALDELYKIFDVEPIKKRVVYDGKSPITVTATDWQDQHQELWELLVPANGCASTVQGEVIRVTGRVHDELNRNGGCNWDKQYKMMLDALLNYFTLGTSLNSDIMNEVSTLVKEVYNGDNFDNTLRISEIGVLWVLDNPTPIALEKPKYKR